MTLEEALKTDHKTALFCLYSDSGPKTVKAKEAKDLLETGKWFRRAGEVPAKAEEPEEPKEEASAEETPVALSPPKKRAKRRSKRKGKA